MAFTHHKLYHSVDQEQQIPVGAEYCVRELKLVSLFVTGFRALKHMGVNYINI